MRKTTILSFVFSIIIVFFFLFFPIKNIFADFCGPCETFNGYTNVCKPANIMIGCNDGEYQCRAGWVEVGCNQYECVPGLACDWQEYDYYCIYYEDPCASYRCTQPAYDYDFCAWQQWVCTKPEYQYDPCAYRINEPNCYYYCKSYERCEDNKCVSIEESDTCFGFFCDGQNLCCVSNNNPCTSGSSCWCAENCDQIGANNSCSSDADCTGPAPCPRGLTGEWYCNSGGCQAYCTNDGSDPGLVGPTAPPPVFIPTNTPTPTLYPTSTIQGNLIQQTGKNDPTQCSIYSGLAPSINLIPQNSTDGITVNCTSSSSTYTCNINYNNQQHQAIPVSQPFSLSAFSSAGSGTWHSANQCLGSTQSSIVIESGQTYTNTAYNTDIFFYVAPWIKTVNSSVHAGSISFTIPLSVNSFDETEDDPGNRVILDGKPGIITSASSFPDSTQAPLTVKTPDDWKKSSYNLSRRFSFDVFYSYLLSRKQYKQIANLDNINNETDSHIFYYDAIDTPLIIDVVPTRNMVLMVRGNVTIPNNIDLANNVGFALITSGTITVGNNVSLLEGVYSAPFFDTGENNSLGLKIKGNLSTENLNNQRSQLSNSKPSILIVHDINQFINLLPYLSISKYEQTIQ